MLVVTARQMSYRMKSCTPRQADLVHPWESKAELCQAAVRSYALTVQPTISVGIQTAAGAGPKGEHSSDVVQPVQSLEWKRDLESFRQL